MWLFSKGLGLLIRQDVQCHLSLPFGFVVTLEDALPQVARMSIYDVWKYDTSQTFGVIRVSVYFVLHRVSLSSSVSPWNTTD